MITLPNHIVFAEVEDRIARGEEVTMRLVGTSMHPTLRNCKDLVTLTPLNTPFSIGEVYLFRYGGVHLLHRLIAIEGESLIFRGDNCVGSESVQKSDIVAHLKAVSKNGKTITTDSDKWRKLSNWAKIRGFIKRICIKLMNRERRRRYRPWYFLGLALLMWLPLNGLSIVIPNYILGLRADHFVHASVFIPCTWMLMDLVGRRWWHRWGLLLMGTLVGMITEFGQFLLPYRGFDINDMVANFFGVMLGWIFYMIKTKKTKIR